MPRANLIQVRVEHQDPLIAGGAAALLESCGMFAVARGSADPIPSRPSDRAAVVIADYDSGLRLPAGQGGDTRILILTHLVSEMQIRAAVEKGIRGYLHVTCTIAALCEAVLALNRGATAFSPLVTTRIADSL